MPLSQERHPLTSEQRTQLNEDLAYIEERLQAIALLMRACFGEGAQPDIRAGEVAGALQRLKWELDRTELKKRAAAG
jgi:hypothetical protein